MIEHMYAKLNISNEVFAFCERIENGLADRFREIDRIAEHNQMKVLYAMQKNRVSDIHFAASTGYGYNDLGRETLENVYASVFNTESALVRPQLMSGTHALTVAFFGNLRPGDELIAAAGKPYDTLEGVIGIRETNGSLKEFGIVYKQVELLESGGLDYPGIKNAITDKTKMVTIQRSKGYSLRPTLSVEEIGKLIAFVKGINP
ncbi:MAG: methionine gamma-lyase family protein, partial [Vallitaleaceae bacterium]|nr:methionine gamma-lyase family protein [Vallitaleaceae bacterium]